MVSRSASHSLRLGLSLRKYWVVVVSWDEALFDVADLVEPGLRQGKALAICTNHFYLAE